MQAWNTNHWRACMHLCERTLSTRGLTRGNREACCVTLCTCCSKLGAGIDEGAPFDVDAAPPASQVPFNTGRASLNGDGLLCEPGVPGAVEPAGDCKQA
jgi:hypothetical protein